MSDIGDRLTGLGYPPLDELDEHSHELVEDYDTVAPTLAAFAARGWLVGWYLEDLFDEWGASGLITDVLAAAGITATVDEVEDGPLIVTLGGFAGERFDVDPDPTSDEPMADFAYHVLGLAAHLLESRGWVLIEDADAELVLTAAVPAACWDALDDDDRGDCRRIAADARAWNRPDPTRKPPQYWN